MPFSRMAEDERVTPIIVHHFVKAAAVTESPPEMESIAWAGFQEWARQWILLSRRSKYDPDNAGHHELWLSAGGSAGHSVAKAVDVDEGSRDDVGGRRWEVSVNSIGAAVRDKVESHEALKEQREAEKHERQLTKTLGTVRDALRASPDGLTFRRLRDDFALKGPLLHEALDALSKSHEIEACEIISSNKQTYEGYRIPQPTQSLGTSGTTGDALGTIRFVPSGTQQHTGDRGPPPLIGGVPTVCVHADKSRSDACPETSPGTKRRKRKPVSASTSGGQ